ncbi:phosphatidylserine decarboxylase [Candidatus Kinetoplastibacterium desouzaii TCC079E]|uniref:Phosphatidylserine decarboxylase proenzyme n=1 Tax=Candidatus Kinetoplastidibacterium desouzai TCC079E TaxID=1208919 RepID=M1L2C7_9PROT|nr:archaetidylserine decarboxylase [Candidatus Kinetoplastibacterium desouzaii]AGF46903.1 phosphatidylserine decarboxylase [Candidatus Kinetoplastibacterium desouzaii TCC079E]
MNSIKNKLLLVAQYLLPHHFISKIFWCFANCRILWFKNFLIRYFIKKYNIDLKEYKFQNYYEYISFNDFFTRPLSNVHYRLNEQQYKENILISPADGLINEYGYISNGTLIQAKSHIYSVYNLLGNNLEDSNKFNKGSFINIYLSPRNYHRVHMPLDGLLEKIIHIPGKLFSVNPFIAKKIPNLYARNERVVCLFETISGSMAVILVGSMIVSSIETVWTGMINSNVPISNIHTFNINTIKHPLFLKKGEELGKFRIGSTVIVLFSNNKIDWDNVLDSRKDVFFGQKIAMF